ncbi:MULTISPECIES: hypothetical protein [unclassified Streptomyces]|uniref:hypothetical protein n=1 Tax=unclassified Streptomyces TaxID=2593676 RepID=UPI003D8AF831
MADVNKFLEDSVRAKIAWLRDRATEILREPGESIYDPETRAGVLREEADRRERQLEGSGE